MRKTTATALIGAGTFSLALAIATPLVIAPALLKAPSEVNVTTHSRSAAQKLNSVTGQLEPITVDLTRSLRNHVTAGKVAGSSSLGVYDELLDLKVVNADGTLPPSVVDGKYAGLKAGESVIVFDRKTGTGVHKLGDTWNTTGQTVKFPFGTDKKTYQYFDQTSKRAWPVSFVRTTTVDGLSVYEFHGTIPQTSLGQYGVLAGTDTLYSNAGRTVLVEPVTGAIVSSTTSPRLSIKTLATGVTTPALLVDELVPTKATVADRVADAKTKKSKAQLLQRAPYGLGLVALLLLGGGILGQRRRQDTVVLPAAPRPDVSGVLPAPRNEPAVDPSKVKS